jgi:hypothetical protein
MSALLIAAALAAQVHAQPPNQSFKGPCADYWRALPAAVDVKPKPLQKLGDLPRAALILPVMRTVQGCPVPTIVRDVVEGDGRFTKP